MYIDCNAIRLYYNLRRFVLRGCCRANFGALSKYAPKCIFIAIISSTIHKNTHYCFFVDTLRYIILQAY